jgi:ABC-type branched-subunit amino acid transport system substrate-binding protein
MGEWTMDAMGDPLDFEGADRVVRLIGALYQRPRLGDRPRELLEESVRWGPGYQEERSERLGLPMVSLVRPNGQRGVLRELARRLEDAKPHGVRHAYLALDPVADKDDVEAVRDILWHARNALINSPRVRGSRLRFGLFTLVVWLMNEKVMEDEPNPDRFLLRRIQRLGLVERFRSTIQNVDDRLPDDKFWWKVPLLVLRGVTALTFRIAVTGRVPILSGQYRWFLRQPHLAPEMSGSFVRFAQRLTDGQWQKEAPEYVCRLLVNAFLEDLRRAYRLRPWQWRRRRMTYPVLLLDDITTTNGGFSLLRLINDVRNQIGLFDPLLVVSASLEVPPDSGVNDPARPRYNAPSASAAYNVWQDKLLEDRRARRDNAWYLPIKIGASASGRDPEDARQLPGAYRLGRRQWRPPWWASRWTRIGAPLVVVALVATLLLVLHEDTRQSQCGTDIVSLTATGTECVGVSDGSFDLFQPSDSSIRQVEQTVLDQNRRAEQLHAASPLRPYITLVDMEALTSSTGTVDGLTAERESLEGFAVAQLRQLSASTNADPIVRILMANAGRDMLRGPQVADILRKMADQDPSIVGVVGLDMSSKATSDTVAALTSAGIPMVAATLSADGLADQNPMYFQVAPQNRREADVVAAYAAQLVTSRTARVYYSDDDTDIYSTNLRDDAVKSFQAKGFQVEAKAFTPNDSGGTPSSAQRYHEQVVGNADAAGRDTCSFDGVVFFAGRGVPDYGDFIHGAAQCGTKAVIIGDDDVSRYAADEKARQQNRAQPYYYASFAIAPVTSPVGIALDFYTTLNQTFPFETTTQGRSLDGHGALSFDAAQVMITATAYLRETAVSIPVTPGTIWREITAIHTSTGADPTNKVIEGVTGTIDYGGDISRNVPENKPVAILRVEGAEVDKTLSGFCGQASGQVASAWCPVSGE